MKVKALTKDERRDAERRQIPNLLPAQFLDSASERTVPCRIYDVSADGISVLTSEALEHGAGLVFVTLRRRLQFTVAWCRSESGGKEHRVGLKLAGDSDDLRQLFAGLFTPVKDASIA